jgi:mRNA interferase MazF
MTAYRAGDIVIVPFPFTDLRTTKRRPALVLAAVEAEPLPSLLVLAMVTSQVETTAIPGDVRIVRWKEARLLHPSKARLAKLVSIEARMSRKRLGALHPADAARVRAELRRLFSAWL